MLEPAGFFFPRPTMNMRYSRPSASVWERASRQSADLQAQINSQTAWGPLPSRKFPGWPRPTLGAAGLSATLESRQQIH